MLQRVLCAQIWAKENNQTIKTDLSKGTANNRFYLVVFWLFWLLSSNSWGRAKITNILPLSCCSGRLCRFILKAVLRCSGRFIIHIYINVWITFYLLSGMLYFVCAWSLSIFIYICVWRSFRLPECFYIWSCRVVCVWYDKQPERQIISG